MKRLVFIVILALCIISLYIGKIPSNIQIVNNKNNFNASSEQESTNTLFPFFEEGYYYYEGSVGQYKIDMSIYSNAKKNSDIIGSYIYINVPKEIMLKGKLDNKILTLSEYNDKGNIRGSFKAIIDNGEKITGTWSSIDGARVYPFQIHIVYIGYAQYDHKYYHAGVVNDQDVEEFAYKIQNYVNNNEKDKLATLMAYPITCKIGKKEIRINNQQEFINYYNKIFNNDIRNALITAFPKYMFANWQGVMLGDNQHNIWIEATMDRPQKFYILTINN